MNFPAPRPGSLILTDLAEHAYHRMSELGSTQAKELLRSAPAKFHYWRGKKRPDKKAFDIGHAVHSRVLGVGSDIVRIPDNYLAKDGAISTKLAKEFVEKARENGQIPLKSEEFQPIQDMTDAVLNHPTASKLLMRGKAEVSVITRDPETGAKVRCRFDYLQFPRDPFAIAVDLKTADDASPDGFLKSVLDYGYHISQEFYRDAYRYATGEEVEFSFIVVEKSPPYMVGQYRLDPKFVEMGRREAAEARRMFAEYSGTGVWPGLSNDIEELAPPYWAVLKHEEKYG